MNQNGWGKRLAWTSLSCALVLAGPEAAQADKTTLRLGAEPGSKLLYRLETQGETNFAGMTITENSGGDVEVEALDSDADGNPRFAFRFANFAASVMRGSDMMEQDPQLDGAVVHVTFTPRGERMEVAPQTSLPSPQRKMVEELSEVFFAYLPENAVEPDDSWVQERFEESETGDREPAVDGEWEYTLEDFEEKDGHECAKLLVQGTLKLNTPTPGGMFTGEAKTEGEILVALDSGHVLNSKLTTDYSGNVGTQEVNRVQYLELKLREK